MYNSEETRAKVAVVIGVAAVSTAALFVRASSAPPVAVAANRLLLTLLLLVPVAMFRCWQEILVTKPLDRAIAALAGVFLAAHFLLWFSSLHLTGVAASVVLVSTHPLFILAYRRLFERERVGIVKMIAILIALCGIAVIALGDWRGLSGHGLAGDLLALGGAVAISGYFLLGRSARKNMSNLNYVSHAYFAAYLVLAAASFAADVPLFSYPSREWLIFLALAVLPTILGHTIFNWALAHVDVSFVSVMILGEPVGASLLAYFLLQDVPPLFHILGGILVLSGLLVFMHQDTS